VALNESKTITLSYGEVGINRWAGASSDQGFIAAGQRAQRGVSFGSEINTDNELFYNGAKRRAAQGRLALDFKKKRPDR